MTEKEIPYENDGSDDENADTDGQNLSSDRQAAISMFASADRIIQNVQHNDSVRFLQQSKQSGGQ